MSETTIAFIKWKQCLIMHNDNKIENQPKKCKELHKIYDAIVKENIKNKKNTTIER
jgi:hypothetical protein